MDQKHLSKTGLVSPVSVDRLQQRNPRHFYALWQGRHKTNEKQIICIKMGR